MTPAEFKAIRRRFFPHSPAAFLAEMGFEGSRNTLLQKARRFENGQLEIPRRVARFAWLLEQWQLLVDIDDVVPQWPEGM